MSPNEKKQFQNSRFFFLVSVVAQNFLESLMSNFVLLTCRCTSDFETQEIIL